MLYLLEGTDHPNGQQLRPSLRPAHLERVKLLVAQGLVVFGGPILPIDSDDPSISNPEGSLIIAEFDSLEIAENWWAQDPYVTGGVFKSTRVRPLRQVVP